MISLLQPQKFRTKNDLSWRLSTRRALICSVIDVNIHRLLWCEKPPSEGNKTVTQKNQGKNLHSLTKRAFANPPLPVLTASQTPFDLPAVPMVTGTTCRPRCWAIRCWAESRRSVTELPAPHAGELADTCPAAIQLEAVNKWQRQRQTDRQRDGSHGWKLISRAEVGGERSCLSGLL